MMVTSRGFTLIEIMIAVTVVGLLTMIGLPAFSTMLANIQIRGGAEALLNGMQTARGEAVQRNASVRFVLGNLTGYTVVIDSTGEVIRTRSEKEGSKTAQITVTPPGATEVTFNSFGRVVANSDATNSITQINVTSATLVSADVRPMNIVVGSSVRMCDPDPGVVAADPRHC